MWPASLIHLAIESGRLLEATGTAILLAAVVAAFILRMEAKRFLAIFGETLWSLRFALLTVASVLGFAFVANWSGMTPTLGRAFTVTGVLFPFMSAFLAWLGVFRLLRLVPQVQGRCHKGSLCAMVPPPTTSSSR